VTQGYKRYHPALDIARAIGTPVKAADSGFVVVAGWSNDGYGNHIVIDHRNGYQTLYAHLNRIYVKAGDSVGKGAEIGQMGNTGRSTGPHLHFEVRKNGVRLNPLSHLP
jgi:murein DD-endopeptidase MepM/ murein hydrolase activator NlpD